MNRKDFLRNAAVFASGVVVLGCERELVGELLPEGSLDAISVDEAKTWFENEYLRKFAGARRAGDKEYRRKANWDKAGKNKDKKNREFLWVPVDYENDNRPAIIGYDKGTEYRLKLAKYFVQPIIEGLIVIKEQGKTSAFLARIAYDPYILKNKLRKLALADFTGWLIRADWDDDLMDGINLVDGKIVGHVKKGSDKGARPQQCDPYSFQYVTLESCGPNCTEAILHLVRGNVCYSSGGGAYSNGDSGYGYYSDGSYYSSGFNPNVTAPSSYATTRAFNMPEVVYNFGSADRQQFNNRIGSTLAATGLAANITGWTWDKAEAIARSVGGDIDEFLPIVKIAGTEVGVDKLIGGLGIAIDGTQFLIGVTDGE